MLSGTVPARNTSTPGSVAPSDLPCRMHAEAVGGMHSSPIPTIASLRVFVILSRRVVKDRVSMLHQVTMTSRSVPVPACTCSR